MNRKIVQRARKRHDSKEHVITAPNMGTKMQIVERRQLMKRMGTVNKRQVATAISGSDKSAEFLLYAGMEFLLMTTKNLYPDSYDVLQMPEIWIGDTAATTDMTPHQMA